MDKREIIANFLHRFSADNYPVEHYFDSADSLLYKLEQLDQPKRNWLAVDEKTPMGALCRMRGGDYGREWRIDNLKSFDPYEDAPYEGNRGMSIEAELFLGIHLIDNPGLEAPPWNGLTLATGTYGGGWVALRQATQFTWSKKDLSAAAPVKWDGCKLVIDLDRLRGES